MAQGSRPPTTGAHRQRAVEQRDSAGTRQHAGLRERHDLEVDQIAIRSRVAHHLRCRRGRPRCRRRTWLRIWVVPCRATARSDAPMTAAPDRCRASSSRALVIDLVDQPRAGLVLVPAHPPQRLVEMRVRLTTMAPPPSSASAWFSPRRSTRCVRRRCRSRPSGPAIGRTSRRSVVIVLGSRASRSRSPSRFTDSTISAPSCTAGNTTTHHRPENR